MPTVPISESRVYFLSHRDGVLESAERFPGSRWREHRRALRSTWAHHFCDVCNAHFGTSGAA